jgi:hypothetical protein
MTGYRYGVHWLAFVVDGPSEEAFVLYDLFFRDLFGSLQGMGHGGRGFHEIWYSLLGFKVYVHPSQGEMDYFHFEIPGQACELIHWQSLQALDDLLRHNYPERYHYTRLDCAFDDVPFTPAEVEAAITSGHVRSLAKRESMRVYKSPFEPRENGDLGTYTVDFGSRKSERMMRVYDRRGFTRLELELKDRRADLVAKEILGSSDICDWGPIAIGHLRDFVSFQTEWWDEFVQDVGRAWATVTTPREISEARTTAWLRRQVSPALSVIHDIGPDNFLEILIREGRVRRQRGNRYELLLSGKQGNLDDSEGQNLQGGTKMGDHGVGDGTWQWCLHCERTYRAGEHREVGGIEMCPYEGCSGDTVVDPWPWKRILAIHPGYPKEPERGEIYALYVRKG